jgi:hypothetical protein
LARVRDFLLDRRSDCHHRSACLRFVKPQTKSKSTHPLTTPQLLFGRVHQFALIDFSIIAFVFL